MHPHIKDRLIAALESGEYPKTKGRLRDEDGFCCLGVLTDLYLKEHDLDWVPSGHYFSLPWELNKRPAWSLLPDSVREWAGIEDEDVDLHSVGSFTTRNCLARLNDGSDTFKPVIKRLKELP